MIRKYDDEFKQKILKKVFDGQAVAAVSREIGVAESLIHKWKRPALRNEANGTRGVDLKELAELKKRNRELEMENEILSDSLREFSAEEVKAILIYRSAKKPLSVADFVSGNECFHQRLLWRA